MKSFQLSFVMITIRITLSMFVLVMEGAELLSVYFIAISKHCITYLALTKLFPCVTDTQASHREIYILCSILLHFV